MIWGDDLQPWQQQVADTALEVHPPGAVDAEGRPIGGHLVYGQVCVVVPRRAGKSRLAQCIGLYRSSQPGGWVWVTAQNGSMAAEMFRLETAPAVAHSVAATRAHVRASQGNERITWDGGGVYKLFSPSPDAIHGAPGTMVLVDEAWSFTAEQGQALEAAARPTGLTRWGAFQFWIISAGGDEGSTWLDRWITLGREGSGSVAYFEWSADPDAPGYDPYSADTIRSAHPAVGNTVPVEAIQADADTMERRAFERSYLGVWERPSEAAKYKLHPELWAAAEGPEVTADSAPVVVVAVDIAQDRSAAAIVAAGRTGGDVALEVIAHQPGTDWIVPALEQLHRARPGVPIVCDALAAATVVAELQRTEVPVQTTGSLQMAQACQVLVDLLNAGHLTWRSNEGLALAAQTAGTRKLRDAWAWSRQHSATDISPLVAGTLAAWASMVSAELVKPTIALGRA